MAVTAVMIEATIAELCRQRSTIGKVKELGARLLKRIDWLKVMKRGGGLAFNVLTGLPSPDQIESIWSGLQSTISDLKTLKPEQIEARLTEAASFLKPAEDVSAMRTWLGDPRARVRCGRA
jgi:hypothetical protein